MGFRILMIAVTGKEPAIIHEQYGVTASGEFDEIPDAPVCGAQIPDGAYVLFINDEIDPDDRVFARLSQGARLVCLHVNETVMYSFGSEWVNGVEQWSVTHDAQEGIYHLETTGTLPDAFPEIRAKQFAEQPNHDDTDYIFDVPAELFVTLGGTRYNQDDERLESNAWQTLIRPKAPGKWWWPFG